MAAKAYVLDTSMIRFFRYPDRTVRELAQQAVLLLLQRWKLGSRDIDAVVFANSGWESMEGQACIRGEVALRGIGIEGMPIINVNTSGGLESRGHPIAATGIAQLHEAFQQLTGRAGKRQVPKARFALTENGGGNIGFEEAALTIHIYEREA